MILIIINTQYLCYKSRLYLFFSKLCIVFINIMFINLIYIDDCKDKLVEIHVLDFFDSTFIHSSNFTLYFLCFLNDWHF